MRVPALVALTCLGLILTAGCAAKVPTTAATTAPTSTAATTTPSTPAAPTSATATTTTAVAARTITITVRGKDVMPAPGVVSLKPGQILRLIVTADRDDELDAHGFGVSKPLMPGRPTTVDLVAGEPGQYEVETHDPSLLLLRVQVR